MNASHAKITSTALGAATLGMFAILVGMQDPPTDIQMPGTQPNEVRSFESSENCLSCHGGYDRETEPWYTWTGSMMAQASRDPLYWAALAVSEQAIPGSGDLCIRCHVNRGWIDGHSTPTDGSFLLDVEADGVSCETCHKMTNTDNSEWLGNMQEPFIANDGGDPPKGYYGNGMLSHWNGEEKLGPYADGNAPHAYDQSNFHRSVEFCGSCHDISNPAVGDLAHNAGAQPWADPVIRSGVPGAPVEEKAAFNNLPHTYGVVERTFSEYMASNWPTTLVSDFNTLPPELQKGGLRRTYEAALLANQGGNYADGTPRYFSCQSCHMRPAVGYGCLFGEERTDLPVHDLTGGNYWMPSVLEYLDSQDRIILGGGLRPEQIDAIYDGAERAYENLNLAASLTVTDNTVRIVNLTGHKLISGYPEGRRMWLNIRWRDADRRIIREDGEYGTINVLINGQPFEVRSLVDLHDPNGLMIAAHMGMTQEWGQQLLDLGFPTDFVLCYDRMNGSPTFTLGDLGSLPPDSAQVTFHFGINNTMIQDNRIPPFGMQREESRKRNILPVPPDQYGNPGPEGVYNHWIDFELNPPKGAVSAVINLVYQPTSWEYIQFLYLANDGSNEFLQNTGRDLLEAWLATGMAEPYVMARVTWGDTVRGGNRGEKKTPIRVFER